MLVARALVFLDAYRLVRGGSSNPNACHFSGCNKLNVLPRMVELMYLQIVSQ
jgi:hypothetical protein